MSTCTRSAKRRTTSSISASSRATSRAGLPGTTPAIPLTALPRNGQAGRDRRRAGPPSRSGAAGARARRGAKPACAEAGAGQHRGARPGAAAGCRAARRQAAAPVPARRPPPPRWRRPPRRWRRSRPRTCRRCRPRRWSSPPPRTPRWPSPPNRRRPPSQRRRSRRAVPNALAEVRTSSDGLRLGFAFPAPTPAALFRRGDMLWLVFDSTAPVDVDRDPPRRRLDRRRYQRDAAGQGAGGPHPSDPSATGLAVDDDPQGWSVNLADSAQTSTQPLTAVAQYRRSVERQGGGGADGRRA